MKNIFKIFAIFIGLALVSLSCREHDAGFTYQGEPLLHWPNGNASTQTLLGGSGNKDIALQYGTMTAVSGTHQVNLVVDPTSTAVAGVDYQIVKGTDELTSGEAKGDFIIRLLDATLSQTDKKLILKLASPTLGNAYPNTADAAKRIYTITMKKSCPSNLAGAYTYSTVNYGQGTNVVAGPITGTGTLGATTTPGKYSITDAAFGVYINFWSPPDNVPATGISLIDTCGKLSFSGVNQYGDSWTISNVSVNGTKLTFKWTSSYNEFGTTTLTRTDGTNWPTNLH